MTLAEKRDELLAKSTAFAKKLAEGEALTEEEQQEFDGLKAATDDVISRMKSAEEASAMVKSLGTPALPAKEDTLAGDQAPQAKSIGDYFVQGAKSSGVLARLKSGNRVNPFDMPEFTGSKAAGDVIRPGEPDGCSGVFAAEAWSRATDVLHVPSGGGGAVRR